MRPPASSVALVPVAVIAALAMGACSAKETIREAASGVVVAADSSAARFAAIAEAGESVAAGGPEPAGGLATFVAGQAREGLAEQERIKQLATTGIAANLDRVEDRSPILDTIRAVLPWVGVAGIAALLAYLGLLGPALALVRWAIRSGVGLFVGRATRPKSSAAGRLLAEAIEAGQMDKVKEAASVLRTVSPVIDGEFSARRKQRAGERRRAQRQQHKQHTKTAARAIAPGPNTKGTA